MRDEEIADIDVAAWWARVEELLAERGKDVDWLIGQLGANKKTVGRWAKGTHRPRWGNVREVLAKLNGARRSGQPELTEDDLVGETEPMAPRDARGEDFLARIERIVRLRKPGASISRARSSEPFGAHLRVETVDGEIVEARIVAGVEQGLDAAMLERFLEVVHAPLSEDATVLGFDLVYGGSPAAPELIKAAGRRRVQVKSFAEYQGLIDFRKYLTEQTRKLAEDAIYPPGLYVPQRALITIGRDESARANAFEAALDLLDTPYPRFVLVLADFGTGKTFLLHELARRLGETKGNLIPVLVEMRALEKARTLDALVAQHLAIAGMEQIDLAAFRYMLEHGRIALFFDGFDELALRVSYDRAVEHFDTLIEAARGNAKIVITSRSQHFLNDQQIKSALAERADRIPGSRMVRLQPFDEAQIRRFLVNRLGSEEAAERRFALLHDVRDLLGLSANPRMLSFIAEVEEEKLVEAKKTDGEITSAGLYRLLLEKWIVHEFERAHPKGMPKGLDREQRWKAVTELAMRLWTQTEKTVDVNALPAEFCAAIQALGPHAIEHGEIKHAIGSGTLLVRDEEGGFSFVHQSVLEWLVANAAAEDVKARRAPAVLAAREMSDLMADFFGALATRDLASSWSERALAGGEGDIETKNALRVQRRLGSRKTSVVDLAGRDLRGEDLSERDLQGANLRGANLEGVRLAGAYLEGATLAEARLKGADLSKAVLLGADLTNADLTSARLLGADMRWAVLAGARLRYAGLVGAKVEPGALIEADTLAATPPQPADVSTLMNSLVTSGTCVSMSPDGLLVVSGHVDGTLKLWDAASGKLKLPLVGHRRRVTAIVFAPDGLTFASASDDATIHLWDVSVGRVRQSFSGQYPVADVAFSPDGLSLAAASEDTIVNVWNLSAGEIGRALAGHGNWVTGVAFSPDGSMIASASYDKTVRVWNVSSGDLMHTLSRHRDTVTAVAFSPDSLTIASASRDGTIRLFDAASGVCKSLLEGHSDSVAAIVFSPDGQMIASASYDKSVRLWDVPFGNHISTIKGHEEAVVDVTFSPGGLTLASISHDATVCLWDMPFGKLKQAWGGREHAEFAITGIALAPDGGTLASVSSDKAVRIWDVLSGRLRRYVKGHDQVVTGVVFSFDGSTLVSVSHDNIVRLWDVLSGKIKQYSDGHRGKITCVAVAPRNWAFASAHSDMSVLLWDSASGRVKWSLKGHTEEVTSIAFAPRGVALASASIDKTVRLWDGASGKLERTLEGHAGTVTSVIFAPDGRSLASASGDRSVCIWDVASGKIKRTLEGHVNAVVCVAFSPDGLTLASGSDDGTVCVWEASSGRLRRALDGHGRRVTGVAFTSDGLIIISASHDGTIRLWSVATGAQLATLIPRPEGWAAVLPDGRYKMGGDIAGAFWHVIGLVRFEPGELDPYLPKPLRIPDDEPLFSPEALRNT